LALTEAQLRVRIGVDKDMHVVKGAHELDMAGTQHTVTEDVTGHITDTDHCEILGAGINPHLTEMALYRDPGAPGGNAHLLVVITVTAAGGKRVSQPEAVLGGQGVGDIGEGCRSLVGGNNQIRVIGVMTHHSSRRYDRSEEHTSELQSRENLVCRLLL